MKLRERIFGGTVRRVVTEMIGRAVAGASMWRSSAAMSVDRTQTNYAFYDKLRNGQAVGYELAGLMTAPVANIIAAWVLDEGPRAELVTPPDDDTDETDPLRYTERQVRAFLRRIRGLLAGVLVDLYGLGDQYIIVNPDGSLSVPSPDTVQKFTDPLDYRRAVRYVVTTKLETVTITDDYRLEGRKVTIKNAGREAVEYAGDTIPAGAQREFEFENLLGVIPVVHLASDRRGNETHGKPLVAPLLKALERYDALLTKAIDGAGMLSNPIPVFQGMEDIEQTIDANSEPVDDDWTDEDGATRSRTRIVWDKLSALFIGKGGSFQFAAPVSGFTGDIKGLLKLIFLLVLEFVRIPEAIWGGELGQARASAAEQIRTFYMHITARRMEIEGEGEDTDLAMEANGGLLELIAIWLRTRALTDNRVQPVPVRLIWPELSVQDSQVTLKWAAAMHSAGVIRDKTYVDLSGLTEDAAAEVEAARAEDNERETERRADVPDIEIGGVGQPEPNALDMGDETPDEDALGQVA